MSEKYKQKRKNKLRNTKKNIKNRLIKDEKNYIVYHTFNDGGYNLPDV